MFCPKGVSIQSIVWFEGTRGIRKPEEGCILIGASNYKKEAKVNFVMFLVENLVKKL